MRTNTYDASRNRVTIDQDRADAFHQLAAYYANVSRLPQGSAWRGRLGAFAIYSSRGSERYNFRLNDVKAESR